MDEIVRELVNSLGTEELEGDVPLQLEKNQAGVPISKNNFHSLPERVEKNVSFVDGGNAEVLGAANFSLQFMRIGCVSYGGKTTREKEEFYLMIKFENEKFTVKTFPSGKLPALEFDSFDPRLRTGSSRIVAAKVGGVCRRIAELNFALQQDTDYVVIDGDFTAKTELEEKMISKMDGRFAGLSKTSSVVTKQGRVLGAVLSELGEGIWYYDPVFENSNTCFVKLHESSKHVFRLDVKRNAEELIGVLRKYSSDPVFPGYPYGLVEVDRLARVSDKDVEYLKTKLMTKLGKSWTSVKTYLRTKDAHEILDGVG